MAIKFQKLTATAVRRLKSKQKLSEHGITFERMANGDGHYSVNVMVEGQRLHRIVGKESDGTTRTQAEEYIEKLKRDAKDQRLSLPKGRKLALGFRDAADKYIKRLGLEGGRDLEKKRQRLAQHLTPFFGDNPLSRITTSEIERYKKQRLNEPNRMKKTEATNDSEPPTLTKPGTVNRELAVLSHLLGNAVEWGWIDKRPAKIVRCKEGQGRIVYLTVEQSNKLLETAQADECPYIHAFVFIGLETSMRKSEILSIRREHVDLERRSIYIPKAKAGAREQPITARLSAFLKDRVNNLSADTPWIFPSPASASGHAVDVRKPFRRVVIAAGMNPDEVVRHTLRHTAITHLVQSGVDLPTVKRISGHRTLIMVERYAHQNGAHIQAAMDKLESRYASAAPEQVSANQDSP